MIPIRHEGVKTADWVYLDQRVSHSARNNSIALSKGIARTAALIGVVVSINRKYLRDTALSNGSGYFIGTLLPLIFSASSFLLFPFMGYHLGR